MKFNLNWRTGVGGDARTTKVSCRLIKINSDGPNGDDAMKVVRFFRKRIRAAESTYNSGASDNTTKRRVFQHGR